jgi:hypothetical protein
VTTPPRIIIDRETKAAEVTRLVAVAHHEAQRRKRWLTVGRVAWSVFVIVCIVAIVAGCALLGVMLLGAR